MHGIQNYKDYFFTKLNDVATAHGLSLLLHVYFSNQNEECGMIVVKKHEKTVMVARYRIEGKDFTITTPVVGVSFEPGQDSKELEAIKAALDYKALDNGKKDFNFNYSEGDKC